MPSDGEMCQLALGFENSYKLPLASIVSFKIRAMLEIAVSVFKWMCARDLAQKLSNYSSMSSGNQSVSI